MLKPKINKSDFDLKMDSGINSRTLRKIFKIFHLKYDAKKDRFYCKRKKKKPVPCRLVIRDQHDNETKPHYILDIVFEDCKMGGMISYAVRYCDYHSTKVKSGKKSKNVIQTAPGRWYIDIWFPKGSNPKTKEIAKKISAAYAKAMEKELPDYEIVHAKKPIRVA